MKKYTFIILVLLISATTFAQKISNKQKQSIPAQRTKFFVDEKEADILVAKLIDPSNYASIGVSGISSGDISTNKMVNKPKGLIMVTKPDVKFMNLAQFFERYKVPTANQQTIKVNGDLLRMKENFLANESRIAKVELKENASGAFINIIVK